MTTLSQAAAALRILDANANRASEALRTAEDYLRFVLESHSHPDNSSHLYLYVVFIME